MFKVTENEVRAAGVIVYTAADAYSKCELCFNTWECDGSPKELVSGHFETLTGSVVFEHKFDSGSTLHDVVMAITEPFTDRMLYISKWEVEPQSSAFEEYAHQFHFVAVVLGKIRELMIETGLL